MRGPMTRPELVSSRKWRAAMEGIEHPANSVPRETAILSGEERHAEPEAFVFADR